MQRRTFAASLVVAILIGTSLVASPGGYAGEGGGRRPIVQIFGPESHITAPRFHRIRDQAAWEALWTDHAGPGSARVAAVSTAPQIDFERCEVIAFFRGPATNIRGERVESLTASGDTLLLRFESSTYQTAAGFGAGRDAGVACAPFGLWIIDRTEQPIVIEENVQNLIGQPPIWRERERLEIAP